MPRLSRTLPLVSSVLVLLACGGLGSNSEDAPGNAGSTDAPAEDCSDKKAVDLSGPLTQGEGTHQGLAMVGKSGEATLEIRADTQTVVVTAADGTVFEDRYDPSQCDTASVGPDEYQMTLAMHEDDRLMTLGIAPADGSVYGMRVSIEDDSGPLMAAVFSAERAE